MIIYGRDTLYSFSGEFGSGCNRSLVHSSFSTVSNTTLSPVTCEHGGVSDSNRWRYEGLVWLCITSKFGAVWMAGSGERIFLISESLEA